MTQTAAKIVIEPIFEADADRAHVQVTVTDVPGDLVWIVGAAAGETGHPHDSSSRETWKPLGMDDPPERTQDVLTGSSSLFGPCCEFDFWHKLH